MTATETAAEAGPEVESRGRPRWRAVPLALIGLDVLVVIAGAVYGVRRGQDLNWDGLQYHHLYAHLLLRGRLFQDGPQAYLGAYLNPLPAVPFTWMTLHLPPRVVGAVLGAVYALAFPVVRRLTLHLLPTMLRPVTRQALAVVGAVLAVTGALYLSTFATSMADTPMAIALLAALTLVLRPDRPTVLRMLVVGLIAGGLVGLKLTSVPFALAACVAAVVRFIEWRSFKPLLGLVVGGVVGTALTGGWWLWLMWAKFGSPVFPTYNGVFHAPGYFDQTYVNQIFSATSVTDLVRFPVQMALGSRRWMDFPVHDPRWLLLAVGAVLVLLRLVLDRVLAARRPERRERLVLVGERDGALVAVLVFAAVATVLWIFQMGVVRYAQSVELVCGAIALVCLGRLLAWRMVPVLPLAAVLTVACVWIPHAHLIRYNHRDWRATWFDINTAAMAKMPRGTVVVQTPPSPSGFVLGYLPDGVRGSVYYPFFAGTRTEDALRAEVRSATQVWVIGSRSGNSAEMYRRLGLRPTKQCVRLDPSLKRTACLATVLPTYDDHWPDRGAIPDRSMG